MKMRIAGIKLFAVCFCAFSILCVNSKMSVHAIEEENIAEQITLREQDSTPEDELDSVADESLEGEDAGEGQDQNDKTTTDNISTTNANAPKISRNSEPDSKVAFIEIENYAIESGLLKAGNNITIKLGLHNISKSVSAQSVLMTLSSDSSMLYPSYGSDNQIFVGTVRPNERVEISIPVTVSSKFSGDAVDLKCKFEYLSGDNAMNNSSTMIITTAGGKSLIVKSAEIGSSAIVNEKTIFSVAFTNSSNINIEDAELVVDGNVSEESKNIALDTVYAGNTYTKDFDIVFTSVGTQEIDVSLAYTDATGERTETDLGTYSINVNEKIAKQNANSLRDSILFWGGRAIAIVSMLIAFVIGIKYIKSR